jgi:eukaryotic-like serine/threonine-protein kinase
MSPNNQSGNMRECVSCKQCFPPGQQACSECFVELVTIEAIPHLINDRYRLDRIVNRGVSSAFFAAFDLEIAQQVAVKIIRPGAMADPRARDRFSLEAELAAGFKHPAVAEVYAFGILPDESAYVVCEYVRGASLRSELRRVGKFPVTQAVQLLSAMAEALDAAHKAGLVHRDLKPESIILTGKSAGALSPPVVEASDDQSLKLVDFSFSRVSGGRVYAPGKTAKLQGLGQLPARPTYLSPEQFLGAEADLRSDIFSLGVIAYEMLAGQPPFAAKRVGDHAGKVLNERPAPLRSFNQDVSIVIEAEILRALEKEPLNRQQRALEFKRELQNALHWK